MVKLSIFGLAADFIVTQAASIEGRRYCVVKMNIKLNALFF